MLACCYHGCAGDLKAENVMIDQQMRAITPLSRCERSTPSVDENAITPSSR